MKNTKPYLTVKDHSVSKEAFQLLYNESLDMLETFPQPAEEKLSGYYKSEDYISHTDSKRNVFEKVYHVVRAMALRRKLRLINSFNSQEKQLLDVGCGTGDFLFTAQNDAWEVSGIEPNQKARDIANVKTNNSVYEIEALLKFKAGSFDVISLWHVLEHLPKLEEHLKVFKSLLKPNGRLVIAVPNYKSYDAKHYKEFWAAYDVPRHLWHFSQNSISKLAAHVNMEVENTLPMKFDAYYVSLLSEKIKTGKMNPFSAFYHGLKSNLKAKAKKEYSSLIYVVKNSK